MSFQFTKMQALGNDFVVIDALHQSIEFTPELIRVIADRHYGIGCDQVLVLAKAFDPRADFGYRIFNADGSEVLQCGNGARCMGLFIQHKGLSTKKQVCLETKHDFLAVIACDNGDFEVDIAHPVFSPPQIPFLTSEKKAPYSLTLTDRVISFDVVNVGNPHAVLHVEAIIPADVVSIGEQLNHHAAFPERVNVGFMRIVSRADVELCVYERGAGVTKACGSGACAAVAVGRQQGLLDENVLVRQQGGNLHVSWQSEAAKIRLRGGAHIVFEGDCSF